MRTGMAWRIINCLQIHVLNGRSPQPWNTGTIVSCFYFLFSIIIIIIYPLNIFLNEEMHIIILEYNYLMCVIIYWALVACVLHKTAILGLQKQFLHIGKTEKQDILQKELVPGTRNPCFAFTGRTCLSVRGLTLIYRDL